MNKELFEKRKKLICELVEDDLYVPMKEKELAVFMQVSSDDREEFRKVLSALLQEGKIQLTAKGKYMKADNRFLTGTFISNARGFGFVEIEGREEDLYIPEDMVNNAFHWPMDPKGPSLMAIIFRKKTLCINSSKSEMDLLHC